MSGKSKGVIPQAQIKAWRKEDAALEKRIDTMNARRRSLQELIKHSLALATLEVDSPAPVIKKRRRNKKKTRTVAVSKPATAPAQVDRRRGRRSPWMKFISDLMATADHGVPYAEIRQQAMKVPDLAKALQRSDKGFYHAISRLNKGEQFKAYKGHLFSKDALARFQADLKAGRVRDIKVPNAAHHSPLGDAIEALAKTRPRGLESGNIIWELRKNPEFAETIEKNKTHPYNVLARLVKTGRLIKRGKRYYSPETETPSDVEGVSNLFGEGGSSPRTDRGAA